MSPARAGPAARTSEAASPARAVSFLDIGISSSETFSSDILEGERLRQARVAQRDQRLPLEHAAESRQKYAATADQGRRVEQAGDDPCGVNLGHYQPV